MNKKFNDLKFGIFIHWGLYSILEEGEWVMFRKNIPASKYRKLADKFNPEKFKMRKWVSLARKAGAKYMVFTSRHHDGFSLFNTEASDFNSVKTSAGRDFVKEYVSACKKAGLKVGIYYSLIDWQYSGYFEGIKKNPESFYKMVSQPHIQVKELMSNYGKIDILWYDGGTIPGMNEKISAKYWQSEKLNEMVRKLQPDILINNRSGLPEDFDTAEQSLISSQKGRNWELCLTIGNSWGYNKNDKDLKSAEELIKILVKVNSLGGNLLLNISPKADGTVPSQQRKILTEIGKWLKINGESIYGTERNEITENNWFWGAITTKKNKIYLHIWEKLKKLELPPTDEKIKNVKVLSGEKLKYRAESKKVVIELPQNFKPVYDVIEIEFEKSPSFSYIPVLLQETETGRYEPSCCSPVTGEQLYNLFRFKNKVKIVNSSEFSNIWRKEKLIVPVKNEVEIKIPLSFDGKYKLHIGYISKKEEKVIFEIPGKFKKVIDIKVVNFPDTITFDECLFEKEIKLKIKGSRSSGIYGIVLQPVYTSILPSYWASIGPFPTGWKPPGDSKEVKKAMRKEHIEEINFKKGYTGIEGKKLRWKYSPDSKENKIDFVERHGEKESGVYYAVVYIKSPDTRKVNLLIGCDWWANAYLNGKMLKTKREKKLVGEDGCYFNGWKPEPVLTKLKKGNNLLLVKVHRGTGGSWLSVFISDRGDLKFSSKSFNFKTSASQI